MSLKITFEREDGSTYEAELDRYAKIVLVGGLVIDVDCLTVGDEIETIGSIDAGWRGHRVI